MKAHRTMKQLVEFVRAKNGVWHAADFSGVDYGAASVPYYPTYCGADVGRNPDCLSHYSAPIGFCGVCRPRLRQEQPQ